MKDCIQGLIWRRASLMVSLTVALVLVANGQVAPANDRFADRVSLPSDGFTGIIDVTAATLDPAESQIPGSAGRSVWWTWTAAETGLIRLAGRGIISVHQGDSLDSLTDLQLLRLSDLPLHRTQRTDDWIRRLLPVTAGTAYHLRLDSQAGVSPPFNWGFPGQKIGTNLWIQLFTHPGASDSFAGRQSAFPERELIFAGNGHATTEPGEPETSLGAGQSVWWTWTVPQTARFEMGTANLSCSVGLFRGGRLEQLERITESAVVPLIVRAGGSSLAPTFSARAGEVLAIRGDSLRNGASNVAIGFQFRPLVPPPNDNLSNALLATNLPGSEVFRGEANLRGATPELGEAPDAERSVWWRWSPPASGDWAIVSSPFLRTRVWLGTQVTDLSLVAEVPPNEWQVRFRAEVGKSYLISLDGPENFTSLTGTMDAGFRILPATQYDDPSAPLEIQTGVSSIRISLAGASVSAAEPWVVPTNLKRSVWMRWRAPADGHLSLTPASGGLVAVAVGSEADVASQNLTCCGSLSSGITVPVTGQTTYLISLLAGSNLPDAVELFADFTSRRLVRPTNGMVFPEDVRELIAELSPAASPDEAAILGAHVQLWPLTSDFIAPPENPFPESSQITLDRATWTGMPTGVWRLNLTLTNEYRRLIRLPPVVVRFPPPNDQLTEAIPIPTFPWSSPPVSLAGSGSDPGEPSGPAATSTNSVWWTWNPPFNGVVVARADQGTLEVFEGTEMAALRPLGRSQFAGVRIATQAGVPLSFRVTPVEGTILPQQIKMTLQAPLPGDDFANRQPLPAGDGPFEVPIGPSSAEPGEPQAENGHPSPSLWWTWTPPESGTLLLRGRPQRAAPFIYSPKWRAFTGTELANLIPLPSLDLQFDQAWDSGAAFQVEAGVPVNIAGTMSYGTNAAFSARLEFIPNPLPGSVGRPLKVDHWSGTAFWFPYSASAGNRISVESSENLTDWNWSETLEIEQTGTFWLGPYRVGWENRFIRIGPIVDSE